MQQVERGPIKKRKGKGETPRRTIRVPNELWQRTHRLAEIKGTDTTKLIISLLEREIKKCPTM